LDLKFNRTTNKIGNIAPLTNKSLSPNNTFYAVNKTRHLTVKNSCTLSF